VEGPSTTSKLALAISKRWLSSFSTSDGLRTSSRVDQRAASAVVCTKGMGWTLLNRPSGLMRPKCVPRDLLLDRQQRSVVAPEYVVPYDVPSLIDIDVGKPARALLTCGATCRGDRPVARNAVARARSYSTRVGLVIISALSRSQRRASAEHHCRLHPPAALARHLVYLSHSRETSLPFSITAFTRFPFRSCHRY
jgi:hypothetical protein